MNPVVLITDGENRSSLAVTRSLGRAGCRVIVTGKTERNISSQSKYCDASYKVSFSVKNVLQNVDKLVEVMERENVDFLFPMTEPAIYSLIKYSRILPKHIKWAAVQPDQVTRIIDKYNLFQLASELGLNIPKTVFIGKPDDLESKISELPAYPVVVKPSMSRIATENGFIATSVKYAHNEKELFELYRNEIGLSYPSLIQERIIGSGTGLFTLFDTDRHLALFSHKRIYEKPPSGGVSVFCESVQIDDEMTDAAQKLLSAVHWQGVAMVEFKRDSRDGKIKLMEINGRFWGSLQLSVSAGIDFPILLLHYLMGKREPGPDKNFRKGLKMRWLIGTLDHLLIRLKSSDKELHVPDSYPSKWKTIVDFFNFMDRSIVYDVFCRRDIGPFVHELKEYARYIVLR